MLKLIEAEIVKAMRNKDKVAQSVFRLTVAKAQGFAKQELVEVNNAHVMQALKSELKQTKESLSMMEKNLFDEEIEVYKTKISLLEGYLPKQISGENLTVAVSNKIEELEELGVEKTMKSMGRVMGALKKDLGDTVQDAALSAEVKMQLNR